jgi:plastocyanin
MRKKFVILTLGLILVAAACNNNATSNETPTPTPTPTPAQTPTPVPTPNPTPPVSTTSTISITSSGFSPATISVKKGSTVTFTNNDTRNRWPASAPHPTHTDYPEFDAKKAIVPGASWTFTFDKVGTWKFHDHIYPSQFGSVTVVE